MSRTLSIDKIGPGPGFLGQALPLSQPSCGDLGVSLRRSSLQFNIRPWRISALGNPLLRLGLPRSIRQSRVAGGALGARRKRAWGSPQRPRIRPQDGMDRAMSGRPSRRLAVLDHAAYRPAPACELAGRRDVGLVNMSRTLSIGKTGPGLDSFEPEPSPSSISTLLRRPRRVSPTLVFAV